MRWKSVDCIMVGWFYWDTTVFSDEHNTEHKLNGI